MAKSLISPKNCNVEADFILHVSQVVGLAQSHSPCGGLVHQPAPVLLIAASGLLLFGDHTPPFGPLTFGTVTVALCLLRWQSMATIKEKTA